MMKLFFVLFFVVFSLNAKPNDCGWVLDNLTSPVCTNAKYIFWTGAIATVGLRYFRRSFSSEVRKQVLKKDHLKHWGEAGGDIGYGYLNGAYFLGQLFFGGKKGNVRAEHMAEASLYAFGLTFALKKSIKEERPGYPGDFDSFPSGHSSFAFAFASVVTAHHGVWWGTLSHIVASLIAFSRMDDDWHYLHDVVAGATIGMSYGWGTYLNHSKHNKSYWFALIPGRDLKSGVLRVAFRY